MDRRDFLKGGVLSATAGLALEGCVPDHADLIPLLVPEEPFVPGQESFHPSTCFECAAGCGLLVRKIDGRLVKVEGNPEHPGSRGGVCARGQALPQSMYHPDRIRKPLLRAGERGDGQWTETSWDEALDRVAAALPRGAAPGGNPAIGFVTSELSGHRLLMVRRFLAALGGGVHLVHEPFTTAPLARANRLATGHDAAFGFDLERAAYVVSFGAEILESHFSPVASARGLAAMRRGRSGRRGKLVMVGPRLSLTAANADEWVPSRPGDELELVLALLAILLSNEGDRMDRAADGFEAFRDLVQARVSPSAVAERTAVPLKRLERLAREMSEHRPALALAGGAVLRSSRGLALALSVSHLNAILGAYDVNGAAALQVPAPAFSDWPPVSESGVEARSLAGGPLPRILFVSDANPMYSLPPGFGFGRELERAELVVSFASFPDETARMADVVLPESMSFERFDDSVPRASLVPIANLSAPLLIRPLHDTRSMPDALLALTKRIGAEDIFPWDGYEQALRQAWSGLGWDDALSKGGSFGGNGAEKLSYRFETETIAAALGASSTTGLSLHVYASTPFGDGRSAHLPFLQDLADPVTGVRWGSVVEIAQSTAESLGIRTGELVEIRAGDVALKARAFVTPGLHPEVVAIAAGQGHTAYGRYASGRGVNAYALLEAALDEDGFLLSRSGIEIRKAVPA
jgi:anaerobic selenocysteine-containing dehydrogenase